jgi:hypothetical protein
MRVNAGDVMNSPAVILIRGAAGLFVVVTSSGDAETQDGTQAGASGASSYWAASLSQQIGRV